MTRIAALLALLWLPFAAQAQSTGVTLVADRVFVAADETLVAEGNVEIFEGDRRLTATRILYDPKTQSLDIEGPLRLEDGPDIVIVANQAALDPGLKDGILTSARLVLQQTLQVTAAEMARVEGRYTQMYKVAATSCQICKNGTPIWQIRAKRIVHDSQEQQLYFDHAVLRVLDIPVFYVPRLRLPDPSLNRASGFMVPRLSNSTLLGTGLKLPYFIRLGDHKDLTVTPYYSSQTKTLELDYRQAFATGDVNASAYVSRDKLLAGESRAAFFADGAFALARGFVLDFNIETTTDRGYLLDYGYSDQDRLESRFTLRRTTRDENILSEFADNRSIRASVDNSTQPTLIGDAYYQRRLFPQWLGGELFLHANAHSHVRTSNNPSDTDGDGLSEGLDLSRLSFGLGWRRDWITSAGLVFGADARVGADYYDIRQDPNFVDPIINTTPSLAFSVGMPLVKTGRSPGVTHVLEPKVQIAWSDETGTLVPNDDSTRIEFDEGNLFDLSRAPGFDQAEQGLRANLGLTWTRTDAQGRIMRLTAGRILRFSGTNAYAATSGLANDQSDWLLAGEFTLPNGIDLLSRLTVSDDLKISKNETRLGVTRDRWAVSTALVYLQEDAAENRPESISELTMDASYKLSPFMTGTLGWRYDLTAESTARAAAGLRYQNECVDLDFSVSRRFTSSATVAPSTEIGLTVGLRGFGTSAGPAIPKRTCRQ